MPTKRSHYFVVEGRYVPPDASPYDDGDRSRSFDSRRRFGKSGELARYVAETVGGNSAAILDCRVLWIKEEVDTIPFTGPEILLLAERSQRRGGLKRSSPKPNDKRRRKKVKT